ncbi:MAG: DUF1028 domain-containing protein [Nitrososphaerota archaeon]|nr:DUF1028 domain-containing protein [Nitrososphaerota archaeon]
MTFSIIAVDKKSGSVGGAVASKLIGVGSLVTHARANIGVVATLTCRSDPIRFRYGQEGLSLLSQQLSADDVLARLLRVDDKKDQMQLSVIDRSGRVATFTGKLMPEWCGNLTGEGFSIQGNTLAGPKVLSSMFDTFSSSTGDFATKLAMALKAGDEAGGDRRGKQGAGLLVVKEYGGVLGISDDVVNLRVDDHPEAVRELIRMLPGYMETFQNRRLSD